MTANTTPDELDTTGRIRIGELARRSGVGRGTIQHYVREGLLPRPVKTHRNRAYYEAECVERIRVIKELQTRGRLPLDRIRDFLDQDLEGGSLLEAVMAAQDATLRAMSPAAQIAALTLDEAAAEFDLDPALVAEVARRGVVSPRPDPDGSVRLRGADLEVLATLGELDKLGFNTRGGFQVDDLTKYLGAMRTLVDAELRAFARIVDAREEEGAARPATARDALDAATRLLMALRRKVVADALGEASARPSDGAG